MYLLAGVLLDAALGYAGGFAFGLTRTNTSVILGPDGTPMVVAHDYTAVPIIGGLVGAVSGLVAGGVLAARRRRHDA